MLKDVLKAIKEPGTVNLKKDLDLWLLTKYTDLGSHGRGHSGNLHPSGISGCARAEVYKRISAPWKETWPMSAQTQRIFDNGSGYHERTQQYYSRMGILHGDWRCHGCEGFGKSAQIEDFPEIPSVIGTGCKFFDCTLPQCPMGYKSEWELGQKIKPSFGYKEPHFYIEEIKVSGYTDGILVFSHTDKAILELKSMRADKWNVLTMPQDAHIEQATLYMKGFDISKTVFQYENKNTQEIKEFSVNYDPAIYAKLETKAKLIWSCLDTEQLPPKECGTIQEGRWCGYKDHCFNDFAENKDYWKIYKESLK